MKGFIVGHYYQWVGPNRVTDNWTREMNAILDRKPHLCKGAMGFHCVAFDGVVGGWYYGHVVQFFKDLGCKSKHTIDRKQIRSRLLHFGH